jgi:hypothetical protein
MLRVAHYRLGTLPKPFAQAMTYCSNFLNSNSLISMEHNFAIDFVVTWSCEMKDNLKHFQL